MINEAEEAAMTSPVQEVGGPSSPHPEPPRRLIKAFRRWYPWMLLAAVLLVGALVMPFLFVGNDATGTGPTTSQSTNNQPSTPAPKPPASPQEQAAAFYSPTGFAARQFFDVSYGGGEDHKGQLSWSDAQIIRNWNDWYRMGCEHPVGWNEVVQGLVDARATALYDRYSTAPSDCTVPFQALGLGGGDSAGAGADRSLNVRSNATATMGAGPYRFVFVTNPQDQAHGVWLLTDTSVPALTQAPATASEQAYTPGNLGEQVIEYYKHRPLVLMSPTPVLDDAGVIDYINAVQAKACTNSLAAGAANEGAVYVNQLQGALDVRSSFYQDRLTQGWPADCDVPLLKQNKDQYTGQHGHMEAFRQLTVGVYDNNTYAAHQVTFMFVDCGGHPLWLLSDRTQPASCQ